MSEVLPQPASCDTAPEVALYATLTANLLLCLLDRLQNTSAYRQSTKARVKALLPELERWVEGDMARIYGQSEKLDKVQYEIQDGLNEIIVRLSNSKVHLLPVIAGLLREFEQAMQNGASEMLIKFNPPK